MTSTQSHTEKEMLAAIARGDEKAFTQLYDQYRDRLYYYLLKITRSNQIAEDVLVDVFMKLWVGRELLLNVENLNSFLRKVAFNKAMNFFTAAARYSKLMDSYQKNMSGKKETAADALLEDHESQRILAEAVNQLPPRRRNIYKMSREAGLTHDQIAETLNLSRNTVKNTIVEATRSISEYLQKNYPGKAAFSVLFFFV